MYTQQMSYLVQDQNSRSTKCPCPDLLEFSSPKSYFECFLPLISPLLDLSLLCNPSVLSYSLHIYCTLPFILVI